MNSNEIDLVKASFNLLHPIAPKAAELFYARLFTVAPSVRPLFSQDLRKQGAMLMQAISLVVRNLDNPQSVLGTLHAMGRRHVAYGAEPAHYDVVGDVLLWTLQECLGESFSSADRLAWGKAYSLISSAMIHGAEAPNP